MDHAELRTLVRNDLVARGAIAGRAEVFAEHFGNFATAQALPDRNDAFVALISWGPMIDDEDHRALSERFFIVGTLGTHLRRSLRDFIIPPRNEPESSNHH